MLGELWRRITESSKDNFLSLGVEELNKGEYRSAQCCFDEAIKRDASNSEAYRCRSEAYGLIGDFDRAMADLDKSLSLDSGNVEAYIARGHVYTEKREFAKAAEDFQMALDLDPDFVADYLNSAYSSGIEVDNISSHSPYDMIRTVRQYKIVNGVSESVAVRRTQQGLPKAMGNAELGLAAWKVSYDLPG